MTPDQHRELQRIGERPCANCDREFAGHLTDRDGNRGRGACDDFTPVEDPDSA